MTKYDFMYVLPNSGNESSPYIALPIQQPTTLYSQALVSVLHMTSKPCSVRFTYIPFRHCTAPFPSGPSHVHILVILSTNLYAQHHFLFLLALFMFLLIALFDQGHNTWIGGVQFAQKKFETHGVQTQVHSSNIILYHFLY